MTLKPLFQGSKRGTVNPGTANRVDSVDVYTVPAGKTAYIKEIIAQMRGNTADNIGLVVVKSGGTGIANNVAISNTSMLSPANSSTLINDAVVIMEAAANAATNQIVSRNTVLAAGDKIQMYIVNGTGALNETNYGMQLLIHGDET